MRRSVLLVTTLALLLAFSGLASASQKSFTIQVQGSGVVTVSPTKAQMWVGAKTDGETASEVLGRSNEVVEGLLEVIAQYTTPDAVRTSDFSMYQNDRWDPDTQQYEPYGFSVRHVFEVHIFNLDNVAPFLDRITQVGANIIYGLSYGVQDYRPPREEAVAKAMEEAWWKARVIADANSALDLVLESVEEAYYYGSDYSSMPVEAQDGAGAFVPGQLQVSAAVTATFRAYLPEE